MNENVSKVLIGLESNNINAVYAETKAEVCEIVKNMLSYGAVITAGGSMSLKESGVWDIINSPEYDFRDRTKSGISDEERLEAFKSAIGCDFFFCSTNALTEKGELVNVDGNGNRVASLVYGPDHVMILAGMNKVAMDEESAIKRVHTAAAPMNTVRLGLNTPCSTTGGCKNCLSPDCVCALTVITRYNRLKGRI